jgi:hypothetical protein
MPFNAKDYPPSEDIDRIALEDEFYRMYKADSEDPQSARFKMRLRNFFEDDQDKAKVLDIAYHIAPLIVDIATDFLFGEPVSIEADTKNEADQVWLDEVIKRNNLQTRLAESSALFQTVGHAHFKLYRSEDKCSIEEIPFDYWFPNWRGVPLGGQPESYQIVVHLKDSENPLKKYIYIEDWYMEGTAKVAKSLWMDKGGKIGDQVPLSTLGIVPSVGAVMEDMTAVEDTKLDEIPIVYLNIRKTAKDRHAESILKKVRPLLHELNDRMTQLSLQFMKHLNAKLQLPYNAVSRDPKTGRIQREDLDVLLAQEGDKDAKYITNENPLIEQAFTHIENTLRAIAKLTQTPDDFIVGAEKGGVEKAEAIKVRFMPLLKRVRFYETQYEQAIRAMFRIAGKIEGKKEIPLIVTFDAGLPKDWEHDVRVWGDALSSGLASKETAVGMFQGLEGDELIREMERIKGDERLMMGRLVADDDEDEDEE